LVLALAVRPDVARAQDRPDGPAPTASQPAPAPTPPQSLDHTIEAGEAESKEPARSLVEWNHYEGPFFSIRAGGGVLYDYAGYSQDANSKEQFSLSPELKLRDARVLLKGRLKFKRAVTWSSGLMYDGPSGAWLVRETGIMVEVPEIWGHIFVGRTKEGFSLNKVMVGYAGWTLERATINDATIPILADGVKWLGYLPKKHLLWNLGFYGDSLSVGQSFSTYRRQVAGRVAWVPMVSSDGGRLLHVGIKRACGQAEGRRSDSAHARRPFPLHIFSTPACSLPAKQRRRRSRPTTGPAHCCSAASTSCSRLTHLSLGIPCFTVATPLPPGF
jgi:phosphate-selective porin OprO/OprP